MTRSADAAARLVNRIPPDARRWILPVLLVVGVAAILVACAPLGAGVTPSGASALPSGATPTPTATPLLTPNPNSIPLAPATPDNPLSLMAWLFTPVFQALFILLVAFEQLTGNMMIAIIIVTLLVRALLIPLYRRQIVSQKRTQLLAPELKEIQRRYKGDRVKVQQATSEFYKERGVNPASGCLPLVLQFILLIPMYSVFSQGLQNVDPNHMLNVFGVQLIDLHCGIVPPPHPGPVIPCINSTVLGVDLAQPSVLFTLPILGLGVSILAIISALLQLVQSRMALPPAAAGTGADDQNIKIQRQTMIFIPFISVFYGGFLPAGLFIYWIVSTLFSVVQQYLILGWGGMFPFLGYDPAWAKGHTPRFPVAIPAPDPTKRAPTSVLTDTDERAAKAASTVRPRERSGRKGRRGRRR
jgi:YidC/Oxa1 family membrane protein insertase